MPTNELRQSLSELRHQLQQLDSGDHQARSRIELLVSELEAQLDQPRDQDQVQALHQSLPGLIEQFEVEHPKLTGVLNQIMLSLSNMGI